MHHYGVRNLWLYLGVSFIIDYRRLMSITLIHEGNIFSSDSCDFCCVPGPQSKVSRCQPNEHNCLGTEHCIPMTELCNGENDCVDGSDEGVHCRGKYAPALSVLVMSVC